MPGVAVVTGAGRGFGREIARGLADAATPCSPLTSTPSRGRHGGRDRRLLDAARRSRSRAHRTAASAAAERGPLEVWVNNAGVMRAARSWEQSDDDVRLQVDVNLMGVIWGSRAAVEAMHHGSGDNRHIINIASLSSLTPVPGLAFYAARSTRCSASPARSRATSLDAGIPITVHDSAPTRGHAAASGPRHEPAAAINWSGPRLLTPAEVAKHAVALLDSKTLVRVIPRWRGWGARATAMLGRPGLRSAGLLRRQGARHRAKAMNGGST